MTLNQIGFSNLRFHIIFHGFIQYKCILEMIQILVSLTECIQKYSGYFKNHIDFHSYTFSIFYFYTLIPCWYYILGLATCFCSF